MHAQEEHLLAAQALWDTSMQNMVNGHYEHLHAVEVLHGRSVEGWWMREGVLREVVGWGGWDEGGWDEGGCVEGGRAG